MPGVVNTRDLVGSQSWHLVSVRERERARALGRKVLIGSSVAAMRPPSSERPPSETSVEQDMSVTHNPPMSLRSCLRYRGYSKLRTHTALGSYSRAMPRSIGPP